ncbi:conserved hypothetical protein [Methylobacterium sp. 4-46]|uniref:DUF2232 domain-containing protein n=1 Tax=unclassified Methylobacterium TaxID=2615210 RepID=UPI000165CAB5|nr:MULTISPECIES: DUF2232 domain-containing protein [Methylobacterium]ACA17031.1 conserved hypothetical protein [Methylobacterium sp. 4-46]WFT82720.1 DUF2232 domain-containing protein [Methylobacterium nodulans]
MASSLGIGVVAGLASALLIGVIVTATPLALLLYLLAPLPILIVSLGWRHRTGLVAAATGTLALMLAASPLRGLAFLVSTALPAWWLGYLALLGRPSGSGAPGAMEWYPLGRLLAWIAGTAAVALILVVVISSGDFAAYEERMRRIARGVTQIEMQSVRPDAETLPEGDLARIADRLLRIAPAVMGTTFTLLLTFYLWAAGRIVQLSGRLPRPWPDLPATAMPRAVVAGLVAAAALGLAPGFPGIFGIGLAGALGAAFALQGLAALHDRSRGRPGRAPLLIGLYLLVFLTQGIALTALALFGLADTLFRLRRRPAEVPAP